MPDCLSTLPTVSSALWSSVLLGIHTPLSGSEPELWHPLQTHPVGGPDPRGWVPEAPLFQVPPHPLLSRASVGSSSVLHMVTQTAFPRAYLGTLRSELTIGTCVYCWAFCPVLLVDVLFFIKVKQAGQDLLTSLESIQLSIS